MSAAGLVLECTPQAQFDQGVRSELASLAELMQWTIHETTLALSHQWACRRHRWWAILGPRSWHTTTLLKWPMSTTFQTVGDVLPTWGCWPDLQEEELQLTPREWQAYSSPEYGSDQRLLTLDSMAPTFLHSYGNALGRCPCGCRQFPFADATLRMRGLRGCYILSLLTEAPRFLHPYELAALLGFPATMSHLPGLRQTLCLLGSVASPLQSLWVFSCLRSLASGHSSATTASTALDFLLQYQRRLIHDYAHLCGTLSQLPRSLSLTTSDGSNLHLVIRGLVTVQQLLQAEAWNLRPGDHHEVWDGLRPLPADQPLLTVGAAGPYILHTISAGHSSIPSTQIIITIEHETQLQVAFITPGTFLFEVLRQCDLPHVSHLYDEHGQRCRLDSRVWMPARFWTSTAFSALPQLA